MASIGMAFKRSFGFWRIVLATALTCALLWLAARGIERLIPRFVDLDALRARIEQETPNALMTQPGWRLRLSRPVVTLTWQGARVFFSEATLLDPGAKPVARAQQAALIARYWPMLIGGTPELGRGEIETLHVDMPTRPPFKPLQKPPPEEKQPVTLQDFSLAIERMDGRLGPWAIADRYVIGRSSNMKLAHLASDRDIAVSGEAALWQTSLTGGLQRALGEGWASMVISQGEPAAKSPVSALDLRARNIDPAVAGEWLEALAIHPGITAQGRIETLSAQYRRASGFWGGQANDRIQETVSVFAQTRQPLNWRRGEDGGQAPPGALQASFRAEGRRRLSDILIRLSRRTIDGKNSKLSDALHISGEIENPKALDQPQSDLRAAKARLRVAITDFSLSTLRALPAPDAQTAQALRAIRGKLNGAIDLQGRLLDPDLKGSLRLSDVSATIPALSAQALAQDLSGQIAFNGKRVTARDLRGRLLDGALDLSGTIDRKTNALIDGALTLEGQDVSLMSGLARQLARAQGNPIPDWLQRGRYEGRLSARLRATGAASNPDWEGDAWIRQGVVRAPDAATSSGFRALASGLTGHAIFKGKTIALQSVGFRLLNAPVSLSGVISRAARGRETIAAKMTMTAMPVETLRQSALLASRLSARPPQGLQTLATLNTSGTLSGALSITGLLQNPAFSGQWTLRQVALSPGNALMGLSGLEGTLRLTSSQLTLSGIRGLWQGTRFRLDGAIDRDARNPMAFRRYQAHLTASGDIAALVSRLSTLAPGLMALRERDARGSADVDVFLGGELPQGASQPVLISPTLKSGSIRLRNASFLLTPGGSDRVSVQQADWVVDRNSVIRLRPTQAQLGDVLVSLQGVLNPNTGHYDLTLDSGPSSLRSLARINGLDHSLPLLRAASEKRPLTGEAALTANVTEAGGRATLRFEKIGGPFGESAQWGPVNGQLAMTWRNGEGVIQTVSAGLTARAREFNGEARFEGRRNARDNTITGPFTSHWQRENSALMTANAALSLGAQRLAIDAGEVDFADAGRLTFEGALEQPFNETHRHGQLSLATSTPLNLTLLGPRLGLAAGDMAGSLSGNLVAQGHNQEDAVVLGVLDLDKLSSQPLRIVEASGRVVLEGIDGHFDFSRLALPGVDIAAKGAIDDVAAFPLPLKDVAITGRQFVVAAWQTYVREVVNQRLTAGFLTPLFGPRKPTDPQAPVLFEDASVALDEAVYDNVLVNSVRARMNLASSGFFELLDAKADVAGGKLKGHLAITPLDNQFTQVTLEASGVKANALARALLNAPNQIFGDLKGVIRFTTQGATDEEMTNNVNGDASFVITDGRLPAIAKLETLLTAVNVLRGGVIGLSLNNLLRTMTPFNTNYFTELSGTLRIAQGQAYTTDLLSDGENLDLLIAGRIGLKDAQANLKVTGAMSQDVSGALGKLGKLSLRSLLRYLPGVGFLPGVKNGGILSFVPGVGYVPGFGGRPGERSRFQVKIKGSLEDTSAIHDFEWLP